jgi:hypothetical protein
VLPQRFRPPAPVYRRSVNNGPERACLAIADVSGYTGYLAGVELDHAQDILADVISTIVGSMAPFQLSKLEGDAAFMFLPGDTIDGSSLQDVVEGTYIAFQRRLRDIKLASSCPCDACVRIPSLDLKFVVHQGTIARQTMLGMEELVGPDVILVHRLLKNSFIDATGYEAYAAYTQAAVDAAGIDATQQHLARHIEETDVAGDVVCWVRDLGTRWRAEQDRPRQLLDPARVIRDFTWEVPTSPAITFDYITSPTLRPQWDRTITSYSEETEGGRRGAGTTNHCMHGEMAIREEVLDWHPPFYWMLQGFAASIPGEPSIYLSDELEALPGGGTRVTSRAATIENDPTPEDLGRAMFEQFEREFHKAIASLQEMLSAVAAEAAQQDLATAPVSEGRHLSEPVTD